MRLFKEKDVVNAIDEHTDNNGKLDDDITCILEKVPAVEKEEEEAMMSYGPEAGVFPFSKGELEKLYELAAERIDEMKENTNTLNPYALVGMVLIDILFDDPLVKLNSAIIDYNHCQWQGLRRHKCPIDNDFVYEAKQSSRA